MRAQVPPCCSWYWGSAAGCPPDSSLSAGSGGEAEPGWITWYQPTPGSVRAELSQQKAADSEVSPDTASTCPRGLSSSLNWGRIITAMSKKTFNDHHCTIPAGSASIVTEFLHPSLRRGRQSSTAWSRCWWCSYKWKVALETAVNVQCYMVCIWNKTVTLSQQFAIWSTRHMQGR